MPLPGVQNSEMLATRERTEAMPLERILSGSTCKACTSSPKSSDTSRVP